MLVMRSASEEETLITVGIGSELVFRQIPSTPLRYRGTSYSRPSRSDKLCAVARETEKLRELT